MENKVKRPKLITVINFASIILIIVICALFIFVLDLTRQLDKDHKDNYDLTMNAILFIYSSDYLSEEARSFAASAGIDHYNNYIQETEVNKNTTKAVENLKRIGLTDEETSIVDKMLEISNQLIPFEKEAMDKAKVGDTEAAIASVYGKEYSDKIEQISQLKDQFLAAIGKRMAETINAVDGKLVVIQTVMLALIVLLIALQTMLRFIITRWLIKPTAQICEEMIRLSNGEISERFEVSGNTSEVSEIISALNILRDTICNLTESIEELSDNYSVGDIEAKIDTTHFSGEFKIITEKINSIFEDMVYEVLLILDAFGNLGNGNFNTELTQFKGKKIIANEKFNAIKNNINSISNDLSTLIEGAAEGNLDIKADTSKYSGGWNKIMSGLNNLINAINEPVSESNSILQELSNGNFSVSISKNYKGRFAEMMSSMDKMVKDIGLYISDLTMALGCMSEGNFDLPEPKQHFKGDFKVLEDSVRKIIMDMSNTISSIRISASQVSIGSNQIADGSQILAQGAVKQAAAVEQLSASISNMQEQFRQTNENIVKITSDTQAVETDLHLTFEKMQNLMNEIHEVNAKSTEISKIIKTIEDIAFQTNILSLNAAVEAARAGNAGKGFAVVAEEVRSLAGRSAKSAKETADLISSTVSSIAVVAQNAELTVKTMDAINSTTKEVASDVRAISETVEAELVSIGEIAEGIDQIAEVVQENSATSEESAAASDELSSQTGLLNEMVKNFKIKEF